MSANDGWLSLCLAAAWVLAPRTAPLHRPQAPPRPVYRGIALKADPPAAATPAQRPEASLRLVSREPALPLPGTGLTPGCRF